MNKTTFPQHHNEEATACSSFPHLGVYFKQFQPDHVSKWIQDLANMYHQEPWGYIWTWVPRAGQDAVRIRVGLHSPIILWSEEI